MKEDKKYPWSKADKDVPKGPAPFEAVYAGPEYFNPPQQMFQRVYAGPDYFNSPQSAPAPGAFAPAEPVEKPPIPQNDPNAKYCPGCGNKIDRPFRFCPECGTVLPQTE